MIFHVKNVNEFEKIISENKNVVVDFFADWCGPCQRLGEVIETIDSKNVLDVVFAKINTDEVSELAVAHNVFSIPNVFFYQDGKRIHSFTGALSEDEFVSLAKKHFAL